jgi:tetrahydromethanopterin S-methyltransferase subunit F
MAQVIISEIRAEWVTVEDIARVASLIARFRDAAYQQGATDAALAGIAVGMPKRLAGGVV